MAAVEPLVFHVHWVGALEYRPAGERFCKELDGQLLELSGRAARRGPRRAGQRADKSTLWRALHNAPALCDEAQ
jgi:hypothetical protein